MRHNRYDGSKEVMFFFHSCFKAVKLIELPERKRKKEESSSECKGVVSREIKKNPTKWKEIGGLFGDVKSRTINEGGKFQKRAAF